MKDFTPASSEASAQHCPDFWFVLPPGFTVVDLDEDQEDRTRKLSNSLNRMLHGVGSENILRIVLASEYAIQAIKLSGAVHLSQCFFRDSDEEYIQGILTLYLHGYGSSDQTLAANAIAQSWKKEDDNSEAGVVVLPYGPAAIHTQDIFVSVPDEIHGFGLNKKNIVRQMKIALPLSDGEHTALFAFSTEHLSSWGSFVDIMIQLAGSCSGSEPS